MISESIVIITTNRWTSNIRDKVNQIFSEQLSEYDFEKIANFIYKQVGIKLPAIKKTMVEGRLRKRLRATNLNTFREYTKLVLGKNGHSEIIYLIDTITTNKTNFFREIKHFEYLTNSLLPSIVQKGAGINRPINIWSAGCSSGEEPYTLAMVLHEWSKLNQKIDFNILATDISITVLKKAKQAIYSESDIAPVPQHLRKNYILRSDDNAEVVKMSSLLRDRVTFKVLNLKDVHYDLPHTMDIIFCRNVMIYFDKTTQENIINKYANNLVSKGHLFLGHSESINDLNVPMKVIDSNVYQKVI